jgi:membrane fusion protein (multidrug efflux system)
VNAPNQSKPDSAPPISQAADERPPRRGLLRRARPALLVLAVAGANLGGAWWWEVGRFLQSTDNAYVQGDIVVLGPRVEGDVATIHVADNQPVRAGDPLITLDDRDWRARVAEARAGLAEAEAAITTAERQLSQSRAQSEAAEAQLAQAEAERIRAAADARRSADLVGGGYASRQAAERAVADQRKAEASVRAAEAGIAVQRAQQQVAEAQLRQAQARRDSAAATLALAESSLADTVIRAPFDGIAGNRAAQLGQRVRPGQQLIAVAPPPARQYVVANFKETQLARMRPGQPVQLSVDAIPGLELHGHVDSFAPATGSQFSLLPPENATGNFTKIVQRVPVKVVLDEVPEDARLALLRPGLSVEAEVDTRTDPTTPRGVFSAAAALVGKGER